MSYAYEILTKDGIIYDLYGCLVVKVIFVDFASILDRFFMNVAVSRILKNRWRIEGKQKINFKMVRDDS